MVWHSFAAIGDSFTEGLDDRYPDGRGYRGWADLLAGGLAAGSGGEFRYANLAVRGRLFDQVVDEQVPAVLEMRPDLVSFAAGGNDVLRRTFDAARLGRRLDDAIGSLRAAGIDVVMFKWSGRGIGLPGARVVVPRVTEFNRHIVTVAAKHGAYLVDLTGDDAFLHPALWSVDRLHLSATGHRRVAGHILAALGLDADPAWLDRVPAPERMSWVAARASDARWVTRHLAPWVRRRLTGRSSGDLVEPKRPVLEPLL